MGFICRFLPLQHCLLRLSDFPCSTRRRRIATHSEAAREMLVRGDYVTLHINGVRYLEKAPLPYWLVALDFAFLACMNWRCGCHQRLPCSC